MMALQRNILVNAKAGNLLDSTLATGGWQLAWGVNCATFISSQETILLQRTQPAASCQQPAASNSYLIVSIKKHNHEIKLGK